MAKKAMICFLLQVQIWWSFHLLQSTCWPVREGSTASCTIYKLQHIQLVKQHDVLSADCLKEVSDLEYDGPMECDGALLGAFLSGRASCHRRDDGDF